MIAQHSSGSNEHYTPRAIVEAARRVMGGIDFDPFSCVEANKIVQARAFCALPQNGFLCPWTLEGKPTRVFVNPPGGKLDKKTLEPLPRDENGKQRGPGLSSAAVAWVKTWGEWVCNRASMAFFVGFNLEILRLSQSFKNEGVQAAGEFALCFPRERLGFWNESTSEEDSDPTCANVLVFLPPRAPEFLEPGDKPFYLERFADEFAAFGTVKL